MFDDHAHASAIPPVDYDEQDETWAEGKWSGADLGERIEMLHDEDPKGSVVHEFVEFLNDHIAAHDHYEAAKIARGELARFVEGQGRWWIDRQGG